MKTPPDQPNSCRHSAPKDRRTPKEGGQGGGAKPPEEPPMENSFRPLSPRYSPPQAISHVNPLELPAFPQVAPAETAFGGSPKPVPRGHPCEVSSERIFGKGMRTATFHFSESSGSLNGPDLFTELPFREDPYQTTDSLNCLPPFH